MVLEIYHFQTDCFMPFLAIISGTVTLSNI
jgi:hypothetical protein